LLKAFIQTTWTPTTPGRQVYWQCSSPWQAVSLHYVIEAHGSSNTEWQHRAALRVLQWITK
jgi:hypothetical protein